MENNGTAIQLSNISKYFGAKAQKEYALKDVSVSVRRGEVLMLMGPSGSGKTTLLSIMGCILKPSSGSIVIRGREISGFSQKQLGRIRLRHLGFIFQEYNLFPTLNVLDNVLVALDIRGMTGPKAKKQALTALGSVGMAPKALAMPDTLSGGQKQRLAIARSLAGRPSVILADEPTAALDSDNGRKVVELMRELAHEKNHSVVIVTHDPRAVKYADRLLTIEDGRISNSQNKHAAVGEDE